MLQPAEWIQQSPGDSQSPGESTLVLYSLGNALFDQGGLANTRQSALVLATFDAQGVKKVKAIPFEIGVAQSRVVAPDAETAGKILGKLHIP